jgi:hypothetical protein
MISFKSLQIPTAFANNTILKTEFTLKPNCIFLKHQKVTKRKITKVTANYKSTNSGKNE